MLDFQYILGVRDANCLTPQNQVVEPNIVGILTGRDVHNLHRATLCASVCKYGVHRVHVSTVAFLMAGTILMYVLFKSRRKYLQDRTLSVNVGVVGEKVYEGDFQVIKEVRPQRHRAHTRSVQRGMHTSGRWIPLTLSESGDIELINRRHPSDLWLIFYALSTVSSSCR
jgi:hypothetical protein